MALHRWLLVLGLFYAWGCSVTIEIVREAAARDMQCPADELRIDHLGRGRFAVAGCARTAGYDCVTQRSGLTECHMIGANRTLLPESERVGRVLAKAATQLECPASSVQVAAASGVGRFSAEGCGRRIDYECISHPDCCPFVVPGPLAIEEAVKRMRWSQQDTPELHGSLPKSEIAAVVQRAIGAITKCYSGEAAAGVVEMIFVIGSSGQVEKVATLRSSLGVAKVETCIENVASTFQFSPPKGGGIVVVTYPFVFDDGHPGACSEPPPR